MRLEHHLVGGYVRYISPHIIIYYNKLSTFSFVTCTEDGRLQFKRIPKLVCFCMCLNSKQKFFTV